MKSLFLSVNQFVRISILAAYSVFVVAMSLLPPGNMPHVQVFPGFDKVVHFFMYFFYSILFCWILKAEKRYVRFVYVSLITVGWGVMMEYLQLLMHLGRSFSWYDALANCIGVFFGVYFYCAFMRKYFPRWAEK